MKIKTVAVTLEQVIHTSAKVNFEPGKLYPNTDEVIEKVMFKITKLRNSVCIDHYGKIYRIGEEIDEATAKNLCASDHFDVTITE